MGATPSSLCSAFSPLLSLSNTSSFTADLDAVLGDLNLHRDEAAHVAVIIREELLGHDRVLPRVLAEHGPHLNSRETAKATNGRKNERLQARRETWSFFRPREEHKNVH